MKARPILFSAPMIRALLEGRKTQTRRTKGLEFYSRPENEPERWWAARVRGGIAFMNFVPTPGEHEEACPYGLPGDLLWVRETWAQPTSLDPGPTFYRADYPACVPEHFENVPPADAITWKPSIHMPRKFSRITLEVTDVRVQRLQEISEEDAIAEGIEWNPTRGAYNCGGEWRNNSVPIFRELWSRINGADSWAANPFVWALTFKVTQQNVDAVLKAAA